MKKNKSILVIGIGRELRGDDAVGLEVIRVMREDHPDLADYCTEQDDLSRLMDLWKGRDIIVIDAVMVAARRRPGAIHEIDSMETLMEDMDGLVSSHGMSLGSAFLMGQELDKLPSSIHFVGVEGINWELGSTISEPVKDVIPQVVDRVLAHLSNELYEIRNNEP